MYINGGALMKVLTKPGVVLGCLPRGALVRVYTEGYTLVRVYTKAGALMNVGTEGGAFARVMHWLGCTLKVVHCWGRQGYIGVHC